MAVFAVLCVPTRWFTTLHMPPPLRPTTSLRDMVGLSSPLHNLVNDSFAEGPGSAHAPGDKSLNEWLSGWAKQLDFAAAATLTLLRRALPLCGPGSNAVAILQTAHSMASAGAQLLPRYLLLEAAGAIPWQSTDEWLAKVLEMEALVLEAVGSGNVALVDIDSCTPDWLVHMLAGLAPIFDGLHQRRGERLHQGKLAALGVLPNSRPLLRTRVQACRTSVSLPTLLHRPGGLLIHHPVVLADGRCVHRQ